jgi:hypothetical protein
MVSGSRRAAWSRVSRRRRTSLPSDSRITTSSEPSGIGSRVLPGRLISPFFARRGREPAVGEVHHPRPEGADELAGQLVLILVIGVRFCGDPARP